MKKKNKQVWFPEDRTYLLKTKEWEEPSGFLSTVTQWYELKLRPFKNVETGEVKLYSLSAVEQLGNDTILAHLNSTKEN